MQKLIVIVNNEILDKREMQQTHTILIAQHFFCIIIIEN